MCHALIIEDEWLIAEYLTILAEQAGATSVETARSEDEAIDSAKRHIPDIILSDVSLDTGTGPGAVRIITEALGDIPVIFITATPASCNSCTARSVVLTKPFRADDVITTFHRLMGGPSV